MLQIRFSVKESFSSLCNTFILNLCIVYKLNNWACKHPTKHFALKIVFWVQQTSKKCNKK